MCQLKSLYFDVPTLATTSLLELLLESLHFDGLIPNPEDFEDASFTLCMYVAFGVIRLPFAEALLHAWHYERTFAPRPSVLSFSPTLVDSPSC